MTIQTLKYHIKQKSHFVLFLGSDVSIELGGYTASTITFEILRLIYGPKTDTELLALFQDHYGSSFSFEKVLNAINAPKTHYKKVLADFFGQMTPSEGYHYLAALIKAQYFYPIIFTTNSDHMLEEALEKDTSIEKNIRVIMLLQEDISTLKIPLPENEIVLVKLHGDISQSESLRFLFSETSFLNKETEKLISQVCEKHGVIVVGCRNKDIEIINVLDKIETATKEFFWIDRYPSAVDLREEVHSAIDKYKTSYQIIQGSSFNEIFKELGIPVIKVQIRRFYASKLDQAWIMLDRARSFGTERKTILTQIQTLITDLLQRTDLDEAFALNEFIQYEFDRSGETYRLQQGVQILENSINSYADYMKSYELSEMEYALLRELLNLFLSGNQIPGGRLAHLERLISRGEAFLQRISPKKKFLRSRGLIVLGEALKELSMITEIPEQQRQLYMRTRSHCEEAINLINDIHTPDAKELLGVAYRHLAVTFEIEGDIAFSEDTRREKYEKWRQYSAQAVEILENIGEETSRSYALMNLASSYTRLGEFEVSEGKKKRLLDSGKHLLEKAISLLSHVDEYRGIGWSYIHLCENTRQRLNLTIDHKEQMILLTNLESYANKSVASIKRIEDHLALGLAYEQLGIALYLVFTNSGLDVKIKLEKAVKALQEGINQLSKTGFYRGTGEAYLWLARCQFTLWEKTSGIDFLRSALQSLIHGTISTAINLQEIKTLESLYRLLDENIRKLL